MNVLNKLVVNCLPAVPKPIVRRFANRYIAGEEIQDAVRVVRELSAEGCLATLDVLGEDVHLKDEAIPPKRKILEVLDAISREKLDANVSVKLTQLGLKIDRSFCLGQMNEVVGRAAELKNFIRIDMEDSSCTDDTLWVYRELRRNFGNVGIVLQGYLRRTQADAESLMKSGLGHFRLCKGIYIEPEAIAFKTKQEVNDNYMRVLTAMMKGKAYVGIATHDDDLVSRSAALIRDLGCSKSEYEFQMLLGVRPELRKMILRDGHRLRVYVPFGRQWYQYSVRRFKENPEIAGYVFKALLKKIIPN